MCNVVYNPLGSIVSCAEKSVLQEVPVVFILIGFIIEEKYYRKMPYNIRENRLSGGMSIEKERGVKR